MNEQLAFAGGTLAPGIKNDSVHGRAGTVLRVSLPTKLADQGLVAGSVDCQPPKCRNFSTKVNL